MPAGKGCASKLTANGHSRCSPGGVFSGPTSYSLGRGGPSSMSLTGGFLGALPLLSAGGALWDCLNCGSRHAVSLGTMNTWPCMSCGWHAVLGTHVVGLGPGHEVVPGSPSRLTHVLTCTGPMLNVRTRVSVAQQGQVSQRCMYRPVDWTLQGQACSKTAYLSHRTSTWQT